MLITASECFKYFGCRVVEGQTKNVLRDSRNILGFYRAASLRRSPLSKWGELHPRDDEPILSWRPIPPTWLSWELCACANLDELSRPQSNRGIDWSVWLACLC